jgi:hypothetical protein
MWLSFRPIKISWRRVVTEWCTKHPGKVLNKVSFATLLKEVTESGAKPEWLQSLWDLSTES